MGGKGIVEKRENHTNVVITKGYKKDQNNNNITLHNQGGVTHEVLNIYVYILIFFYCWPLE